MERFEEPYNFEMQETLCFGVEEKWKKYSIPIQVNDEIKETLRSLATRCSARNPIHGDRTIYLKIEGLTTKQRVQLLGAGKCYVHVRFQCSGVYTNAKDSIRYLVLKPTKLARCEREVELEVAED